MPGRPVVARAVERPERRFRRSLRGEAAPVHHDVEGRQVDVRVVRVQDGHEIGPEGARHRGDVVRPVDRRAVVDVVRARNEDGPDAAVDEAPELAGGALHRAARLDIGVEEVAGDQEQVDPLRQGEIDAGDERGVLPLALRRRLVAQVRVPRPEVDIGRVEQAQHRRLRPS